MSRELAARHGDRVVSTLHHLAATCDEARQIVLHSRERFLSDMILQRAAEAIIGRIGDTIRNRLPEALLREYPDQPWSAIVGQRIRIAHLYDSLDYQLVWETLTTSIPALREYIVGTMLRD